VFVVACSAEEAGRVDYFTFGLQSPGDTGPVTEGYFYLPADHPYYPEEECGLFGWDFEGIAAWSDGSIAPVDDSADQGSDTYIQYWAKLDGSLCEPSVAAFADAQFEYNGLRYFLDGNATRSFADLSEITIPPDPSNDWYATGTWSRSDDPNSGEEGYNWVMWPYEYFPSAE
jgi:hypothetical protein